MALGRRHAKTLPPVLVTADLPPPPANPFYQKLNRLLDQAGFDSLVEDLCQPFYAPRLGRPSLPPGIYFRMLFVGYFEGIASQRGIAWRCSDSLSLRDFLGILVHEATPDHSSLSKIRERLPLTVHEHVFTFVLQVAQDKKLLRGKTVAIDATTLEANAAMKSIVRKDSGEDWKEYLKRLMAEEGIDNPTDEEIRRFDKKRKNKKVSNKEWQSPTDEDSRITKMKDGTTHLAYKAEHVVDLDSEFVLAAAVHPADASDSSTLVGSVLQAQANLVLAGSEQEIEEAVADKGYHKAETLAECEQWNTRTYIPEPEGREYNWQDKPQQWRQATLRNRRRVKGSRSKRLQKRRSEWVERSFAHVCETGGGRRSWLRGLDKVTKRYVVQVAAHNMALLVRKLLGMGKPRTLQGGGGNSVWVAWCLYWLSALWGSRRYKRATELCSCAIPGQGCAGLRQFSL
jgi:transposase